MACPDLEELLRQGSGGHAAQCEACRALLDSLAEVDATFETAFSGMEAPPGLAAAVRARVARELPVRAPSLLPEVLDFVGWAAVLAMAALVAPRFVPIVRALLARWG